METQDFGLTKLAYSPNELIRTGVFGSRTSLYRVVNSGKLKLTKQGARTIFLAADVAEYLRSLRGRAASQVAA